MLNKRKSNKLSKEYIDKHSKIFLKGLQYQTSKDLANNHSKDLNNVKDS